MGKQATNTPIAKRTRGYQKMGMKGKIPNDIMIILIPVCRKSTGNW